MAITKWNLVEAAFLLFFIFAMLLLYQVFLDANSPIVYPEGTFKNATLIGAMHFALQDKGSAVVTGDFNFSGPGDLTETSLLKDSELEVKAGGICISRGEVKDGDFYGGIEYGFPNVLRYPAGFRGPYAFVVLCDKASKLSEGLLANSDKKIYAYYFDDCPCLKQPGELCCVAALIHGD